MKNIMFNIFFNDKNTRGFLSASRIWHSKITVQEKKKDLRACPFFSKFIFSTFVALNFFEWGYENKSWPYSLEGIFWAKLELVIEINPMQTLQNKSH